MSDPTNQRAMWWLAVWLTSKTFVQCLLSVKRANIVSPCDRCVFFFFVGIGRTLRAYRKLWWFGVLLLSSFSFYVHLLSCVALNVSSYHLRRVRCVAVWTLFRPIRQHLILCSSLVWCWFLTCSALKAWIGVWDEIFVIFVIIHIRVLFVWRRWDPQLRCNSSRKRSESSVTDEHRAEFGKRWIRLKKDMESQRTLIRTSVNCWF